MLTLALGEVEHLSVGGEQVDLLDAIDGLAAELLESELQLGVLSGGGLVRNLLSLSADTLATRSNLPINSHAKSLQRFRT